MYIFDEYGSPICNSFIVYINSTDVNYYSIILMLLFTNCISNTLTKTKCQKYLTYYVYYAYTFYIYRVNMGINIIYYKFKTMKLFKMV